MENNQAPKKKKRPAGAPAGRRPVQKPVICFVLDWRLFVLSIGLCVLELVLSKKVQQVKARRRGTENAF